MHKNTQFAAWQKLRKGAGILFAIMIFLPNSVFAGVTDVRLIGMYERYDKQLVHPYTEGRFTFKVDDADYTAGARFASVGTCSFANLCLDYLEGLQEAIQPGAGNHTSFSVVDYTVLPNPSMYGYTEVALYDSSHDLITSYEIGSTLFASSGGGLLVHSSETGNEEIFYGFIIFFIMMIFIIWLFRKH